MEEKKTFKTWLKDKKDKVIKFCSDHPDAVLTVVGGLASIAGGCIKLYCSKTEYDDSVYTTIDDQVYKIPAKGMKTCNQVRNEE